MDPITKLHGQMIVSIHDGLRALKAAKADKATIAELRAEIAELRAQVGALRSQHKQLTTTPAVRWEPDAGRVQ